MVKKFFLMLVAALLTQVYAQEIGKPFVPSATNRVSSFSYSPDGRFMAIGGNNGQVHLIDAASKRSIWSEPNRSCINGIQWLEFSPDGKALFVACGNRYELWDSATATRIKTLNLNAPASDGRINSVKFIRGGKAIFVNTFKGTGLLDVETGRQLMIYDAKGLVGDISPDEKTVVVGNFELVASDPFKSPRCLTLFDTQTGNELRKFGGEECTKRLNSIVGVKFTADGKSLLLNRIDRASRTIHGTADEVGVFKLDIDTGAIAPLYQLQGEESARHQTYLVSNDRNTVILFSYKKQVGSDELLQVKRVPGNMAVWNATIDSPGDVRLTNDNKYLSMAYGGVIQTIEVASGRHMEPFTAIGPAVQISIPRFSYAGEGKQLYVANHVSWSYLDPATGKLERGPIATTNSAMTVDRLTEPQTLALAQQSQQFKNLLTITNFPQEVSSDGLFRVALAREAKKITLYDNSSGKELQSWDMTQYKKHSGMMSNDRYSSNEYLPPFARFGLDGKTLLLGNSDNLLVWDLPTMRLRTTHEGEKKFDVVQLRSDGKTLLRSGREARGMWGRIAYQMALMDVASGRDLLAFESVISKEAVEEIQAGKKLEDVRGHVSSINSFDMSADGKWVLSGSADKTMRMWSASTGKVVSTFTGHTAEITRVQFGPDGSVISAANDGTLRVWDIATQKERAQVIGFTDGEWVVITSEGYFDASPKGAKSINIRTGPLTVSSLDGFYDNFYRPDLVRMKLQGKDISALSALSITDALKSLPPAIRLTRVMPVAGSTRVKVCYTADAVGTGGIGEVRLFHNGKLFYSDGQFRDNAKMDKGAVRVADFTTRALQEKVSETLASKNLVVGSTISAARKPDHVEACEETFSTTGDNEYAALAFNAPNTLSSEITVIRHVSTSPAKPARLYAVAVGINRYKDQAATLTYATKDSLDFVKLLQKQSRTLFAPENIIVKTLNDEQATKENILRAFDELTKVVEPQDHVVLFVASHGVVLDGQYYMVPHDFNGNLVPADFLSSNDFIDASKRMAALSQLFIFDTCHAGAIDQVLGGLYDAKLSVLAKKSGLHIYASANSQQEAMDGYKGNGLFTHTLLSGLDNNAIVDVRKRGTVSILDLGSFAKIKTTEIATQIKHSQTPLILNFGQDNELYRLRPN